MAFLKFRCEECKEMGGCELTSPEPINQPRDNILLPYNCPWCVQQTKWIELKK